MKGRNGLTAFLPLSSKIGGLINDDKPSIEQYLTRKQANFVYKKTESGKDDQCRNITTGIRI